MATRWFSTDGSLLIDLDEVVCAEWSHADIEDDDGNVAARGPLELNVWLRGDPSSFSYDREVGIELMTALRRHAHWPEGTPYRG